MTNEKIAKVKAEMIRLKDAILALEKREDWREYAGCRESGAVKRASMDLQNALVDLRRA